VNELEFIRGQVSLERRHMAAVRNACAAALALPADRQPDASFLVAGAEYLRSSLQRFCDQDQAHCDQLRPRLPSGENHDLRALDDLHRTLAASRAALAPLAKALDAHLAGAGTAADVSAALRAFLEFYANVLASRRHALHHLFDAHYGIAEWRAASAVDADAIFEERQRFTRVAALLPHGISLEGPATGAPPQLQAGGDDRDPPDPRRDSPER
jgi:hypothetical protein